MLFPGYRMIGAQHDLACTDLRRQMPQSLRREHHSVEIKLVQIFRWLFLQRDIWIAILRRHEAGVVVARGVGAEIAAAMGSEDLETREAIKRPLEEQMLQGDVSVEWIADCVRQPAVALEARGELRRALRMDEENSAKFFGFGPHRM